MTDGPRSYADPCGVARALDAVGERWALLVVRELSLGPRRFAQLRRALPAISPNVLSQRLRELEDVGVVRRYELEPPANSTAYDLTPAGVALDPVLQALGRWGADRPPAGDREMSPVSFLRSLRVLLVPSAPDGRFSLRVDDEDFTLTVAAGVATVRRGVPADPVATLAGSVTDLRALLLGGAASTTLERDGRLVVSGDRRAARRLPRSFRLPAAAAAPSRSVTASR